MVVTLVSDKDEIKKEYPFPLTVMEIFRQNGIDFPFLCGGKGNCGKCLVRICGDIITQSNGKSIRFSGDGRFPACQTVINGDCRIFYNINSSEFQGEDTILPENRNKSSLFFDSSFACVDIGTTSIAFSRFDYEKGIFSPIKSVINPLVKYGADIISRMEYASANGVLPLKSELDGVLNSIPSEKLIITGNTAMLSFAAGLDTEKLTRSPFEVPSHFGFAEENRFYLPVSSPFFGADGLCALLAIDDSSPFVLADIGTNGEIAVFDGKKYYTASASAGPCFEGAGISTGTIASAGAVHSAFIGKNNMIIPRFSGNACKGICGSGLCDLIYCLIQNKIIDKSGYMEKPYYYYEDLSVTPEDIRKFQLAKSAIRAGIEVLVKKSGIKNYKIYLSGGFGNSLNPISAAGCGIIPEKPTFKIGNGALIGACLVGIDKSNTEKLYKIKEKCVYTELASDEDFADNFIKYMSF